MSLRKECMIMTTNQKFSYSLNSGISYDVWGESVGSLVHPAGFKEFSELTIQTSPTEISGNCELVSGICTSQDNGELLVYLN